MTENFQHLLRNLSRSIDKPVLDDPRLDFTPSPLYFPRIGSQTNVGPATSWIWRAVTPLNKPAKIPLNLRLNRIQIAIGAVEWLDHFSHIAICKHLPILRRSPLFLADVVIETITDENHPDFNKPIIRLCETPEINHSLVSWCQSHDIKITIDPSVPILESFQSEDPRLRPTIFEDVHIGIFLTEHAHLAHSVDPDRNPAILQSHGAALLAGETVAKLPARTFNPRLINDIRTDNEQEKAVHAALRGENFVLIGPPGCGKTQTIAAIIANINRQFPNLTIGVASPVEAALDALDRLTGNLNLKYDKFLIGKCRQPESIDLLIVDESSRTTTAEVFPFAANAKQIIVVGDPNQTPPSPAAPRLNKSDTSLIDFTLKNNNFQKYDIRNHYRSFQPDLLHFSNSVVYNGQLRVVPAPKSEINDGFSITYIPSASSKCGHYSIINELEAIILVDDIINHSIKTNSNGITRSRMIVAWTYAQARFIEKCIKNRLRKLKLSDDILSPISKEPFVVQTPSEIQGQERDETWISFGHGVDPKTNKIATARQPKVDMSDGVFQKMNVLTTRSRVATRVYHSISTIDAINADPSSEILTILTLINIEMIAAHARFQIDPHREANSAAKRMSRNNPELTDPEAYNLGCVYPVRNVGDPPNNWRYGLFHPRREWSEDDTDTARRMLIVKGWKLVDF
jgi:DNA polymerase III delta prime subunit